MSLPQTPQITLEALDQIWSTSPTPISELEVRWDALWTRLDMEPRMGLFETNMSRWCEPHRSYHTPRHLLECLKVLDVLKFYTTQPDAVEFALWYHDIIYNVQQQDNEVRSAELAQAAFLKSGGAPDVAENIRQIVLSTTHRFPVKTVEAAIANDADLAILGAPAWRFDEYEVQVRAEYPHVQDAHFAPGRMRALSPFLARPMIFRTTSLNTAMEPRAQDNLSRSIRKLQAQL